MALAEVTSHTDPGLIWVLSLRILLRFAALGYRRTATRLFEKLYELRLKPEVRLQSAEILGRACLGVAAALDESAIVKALASNLAARHGGRGVPLPAREAWVQLRELDSRLAALSFARASSRRGPPPRRSVESLLTRLATRSPVVRNMCRGSNKVNSNWSAGELIRRAKSAKTKGLDRRRYLAAAARRGRPDALLRLAGLPQTAPPLRRILIQILLSCEDGPLAERRYWRKAILMLNRKKDDPTLTFLRAQHDRTATLLRRLQETPDDPALWTAFYLERERVWCAAGYPALPEWGAWGTPLELLDALKR
ncbi:MAG: hypothetical protein JKY65_16730 [Planctomycetes bacterium]|nr:hypothetical protein [Planctomycetota bacterium]